MNNPNINRSDHAPDAFQARFLGHLLADATEDIAFAIAPPGLRQRADSLDEDLEDLDFELAGLGPDSLGSDELNVDYLEADVFAAFWQEDRLAEGSADTARSPGTLSPEVDPMLELDALPIVQERFRNLLETHLKAQSLHNPPRFPWESAVLEYTDEPLPVTPLPWLAQSQALSLPTTLPEPLFAQLLDRCQDLARSGLQQGRKLVAAVEGLFEVGDQALAEMAALVLRQQELAYRSDRGDRTAELPPVDYATAGGDRQLALAMLAAAELLGSLSLELPVAGGAIERQWLTGSGLLVLTARFERDRRALAAEVHLPCGGQVELFGPNGRTIAERATAGVAAVELFDPTPGSTYTLAINFSDAAELPPLTFAILIPAAGR